MRKLRSDALWHKLTPEQQKKIEHWFFVEILSYRAVHERMRTELGVTCALSIIGPMYHYCRKQRSQERQAVMDRLSEILVDPKCDLERVQPEALTVISGRLMHRAMQQNDTEAVESTGRLMARSEANILKHNANLIAKERLELAEKRLGLKGLVLALETGAITRQQFLEKLSGKNADARKETSGT